jgi:hypothetical protein
MVMVIPSLFGPNHCLVSLPEHAATTATTSTSSFSSTNAASDDDGLFDDLELPAPSDDRRGRHFYDVSQLLGDRRVLDLLSDWAQTEKVMSSIEDINRAFSDWATTSKYAARKDSAPARRSIRTATSPSNFKPPTRRPCRRCISGRAR